MLDLKKVCERALQEGVGPGERAWAWRLLLGVIPASGEAGAVEASLKASRLRYEKLRREHLPDISSSCEEAGDPLTMALGAESGWSRFYASADLRAEIQKDLDRLVISGLPEDHFSRSSFWASMLTVLTVWSTAHPDIGYRQGMHEILALVVLALEDEIAYGCGPAEGDDEADCFSLFEAIMVRHADHFHAGPEAPVVAACRTAQAELLELYEPRLARRLNDYVEPQIYGLRWARLLFSREFEAPASLTLCDALFAAAVGDGDPLAFRRTLQIFFVALLLVCAPRLMAATDEMECLSVLMRPQQCSVLDVVSLARRLIEAQSQTRLANDTIVASVDDRGLPHFTTPLFGGEGGGNADDDSANGSPRAPAVISANDDDDDDDDEALANGLDSVRAFCRGGASPFAGPRCSLKVRQHPGGRRCARQNQIRRRPPQSRLRLARDLRPSDSRFPAGSLSRSPLTATTTTTTTTDPGVRSILPSSTPRVSPPRVPWVSSG